MGRGSDTVEAWIRVGSSGSRSNRDAAGRGRTKPSRSSVGFVMPPWDQSLVTAMREAPAHTIL